MRFYSYRDCELIKCEECVRRDIRLSREGIYVGDELVTREMVTIIADCMTEPYQCDECCVQNEAYEEMGIDPATGEERWI